MNQKEQKSNAIYLMKIWATIFVVFIHSANIFNYSNTQMPTFLISFSMLANSGVPIFMVISGYLFFIKKRNWKENFINKTKRLAIPFVFWNCFWILFEMVGHIIIPNQFEDVLSWKPSDIVGGVIGIPFYSTPFYSPLWYVRDLYIISIVAPIIQKYVKRYPNIFLVTSIVLWLLPINPWFRQTVPLFILGGAIGVYKEKACEIDKQYDYCSIVSFMIGIGMSFMTKNYLAYQLTIMFYLLGTFFMCRRLVRKKRWIGFCKKFIPFIFMIYVLHGKILSILQILYSKVFLSTSMIIMGYFLIPFVCIFICCAFAVIYRKLLPKLYSIFIGELK